MLAGFFALRARIGGSVVALALFVALWLGPLPFTILGWFGIENGSAPGLIVILPTVLVAVLCLRQGPVQRKDSLPASSSM